MNISIEGILFSPIPKESVSFPILVGQASAQPQTIETSNERGVIYKNLEELMSKINRGEIVKQREEPDGVKIDIKKIELMSKTNKDLLIINLEITPEEQYRFGASYSNDEKLYAIEEIVIDDVIDDWFSKTGNTYSTDETGDWNTYYNTFTEDTLFLGTEKKGSKDWDTECPVYFGKTIQAGITDNIKYCFEIPKNVNYFIYLGNMFSKDALKSQSMFETANTSSNGGGCLIATATFGSEFAPQVQQLRELRDNTILQTKSGVSFMTSFNQFYYSFSPSIADLEREQPIFKEFVKITLTPMLSSLSLLNHVEINSEQDMIGYGLSIIIINIGMYFGLPIFGILKLYQSKRQN